MYQNKTKMIVTLVVFGAIFAGCGFVTVVMFLYTILVLTHQVHSVGDVLGMSCFMLTAFGTFSFLSFKKLQKIFRVRKMSRYFEQDKDGLVPIEEIAVYMKMKQHKFVALFLDCIGRNLLYNCTIFPEDPTCLLLENGKKNLTEKFVVKHCPKCGAPSTLRIGFENKCKYCDAVILEKTM